MKKVFCLPLGYPLQKRSAAVKAGRITSLTLTLLLLLAAVVPALVHPGVVLAGDTFTKLPNPATLPNGQGHGVAFSHDSTYMAVAHTTSPYVTIYKRSSDNFTKLADPAILPTGQGNDVAFSHDDTYMAVAHDISPYVTIYKRSSDNFTKLADPDILPTGYGVGIAFSHDSTYLAVGHGTSPYVTIYKRTGDTFTKLPNPATLPVGTGGSVAFSHDSTYLAVPHTFTPFVTIYKRSGDTFTKLANPATLPASIALGVAFSHDSTYLSVAHDLYPNVTIYKRSSDNFTKLTDPATLPTSTGQSVAFSQESTYMAVGHAISPSVTIYKRSGDTFTKLVNPATLPAGDGNSVAFSHDAGYMAVAHNLSPYVTIYKRSGGTDEIGIWRGSTRYFYLDMDGDFTYDGAATERFGPFLSSTLANDRPITGDWNNDGKDEIGIWRGSTRYFYLDMDGDFTYDGAATERFGPFLSSTDASDRPIAGGGDGTDRVGIWRGATRYFYVDMDGDGIYDGAATERRGPFLSSTIANDMPLAADWDGNDSDKVGIWRGSTRYFYLDVNGNFTYDGAATERIGPFLSSTVANDIPLASGSGYADSVGIWRGSTRYFYLDINGNGIYDGAATERFGPFLSSTIANDIPISGNFDGR